jgi:type IV secretory pathway VirB4 component
MPVGAGAHETTTLHVGALYPLVFSTPSSTPGAFVGQDLFGGPFSFDPFTRYESGELTNPNVLLVGQIGRGKSSLVKSFVLRQLAFGRSAMVLDPKGEYAALAQHCGAEVVALEPGGGQRLNPLELDDVGSSLSRLVLLEALGERALERRLSARERAALEVGLATLDARTAERAPTLPELVEVLLVPEATAAAELATSVPELAAEGRDLGLALRRLVVGDLAGMFDGPSTVELDLGAPLVCLDLSALYGSAGLGMLMACAAAWLQAEVRRRALEGRRTLLVFDEAWALLREPAVARWLQASWKLSRAWGVSNVAVLHRLSDLSAVGSEGSELRLLAEGLLADSETRICYQQPPGEVAGSARLLGLTEAEREVLPELPRGVALWKSGSSSTLVRHLLGPAEVALIDTDGAMVGP